MAETPPICSRIPPQLVELLDADAQQQGLTRTEVLNTIVESYYFGSSSLQGPDAGYMQGRKLAGMIAQLALSNAMRSLPDDYETAMQMLRDQQETLRGPRG